MAAQDNSHSLLKQQLVAVDAATRSPNANGPGMAREQSVDTGDLLNFSSSVRHNPRFLSRSNGLEEGVGSVQPGLRPMRVVC